MSSGTDSGTLKALIRTAEWNVDAAQVRHSDAVQLSDQSQRSLTKAQQELEASHERLRQLLSNEVLDAGMLQYQHLQITHHQHQLTTCDQQHVQNVQRVESARRELLSAKLEAETFTRLNDRRQLEAHKIDKQQQQWKADEAGVIRSACVQHPTPITIGE